MFTVIQCIDDDLKQTHCIKMHCGLPLIVLSEIP